MMLRFFLYIYSLFVIAETSTPLSGLARSTTWTTLRTSTSARRTISTSRPIHKTYTSAPSTQQYTNTTLIRQNTSPHSYTISTSTSKTTAADIATSSAPLASTSQEARHATDSSSISASTDKKASSAERRLVSYILDGYDPIARPVRNASHKVLVAVDVDILHLLELREREQVIRLSGWMFVQWKDEFIHWDPADYEGLEKVVLTPDSVWLPDFVVSNSAERLYEEMHYLFHRPIAYSDGSMVWGTGGVYSIKCSIDVTYFPFDDQMCALHIGNWAYDGSMVNLTFGETGVSTGSFTANSEWDLIDVAYERKDQQYFCCPHPFPEVAFMFLWRRKPKYYAVNIIIPCCLLSGLGLLVYKVPHEAGERLSLGITILLAYTVFQLVIADSIPKTSESTPLLGYYLLSIIATSSLTVVVSALSMRLYHTKTSQRPPTWLRRLVARRCCFLLRPPPKPLGIRGLGAKLKGSKQSVVTHGEEEVYREAESWVHLSEREPITSLVSSEATEASCDEWRQVSLFVDQVGFVFSLLFVTVMTVLCFFIIPYRKELPRMKFFT